MTKLSGWIAGVWLPLVLFNLPGITSPVHAQALQGLRQEVRVNDPEPPRSPKPDRDNDEPRYYGGPEEYDGSDNWSLEEIGALGVVGGIVGTAPYWYPVILIGDGPGKTGYFPQYPYEYDAGYMLIDPPEALGASSDRRIFNWAARARADYGTDFAGLNWTGGNLVIETMPRLGIESDFRLYEEQLTAAGLPRFDQVWLGDVNLFFRFAQSERVQMRSGIGVNFLSDQQHTDVGFNFTYAGDFYLAKPWVLSGEFDCGILGDETLFHVRVTTGLQYKGIEAYLGYDMVDVGAFHTDSLVTGLRLWF